MAAALNEPTGKAAGRVTITGLAVSLIPPLFTVLVVVALALLELIGAEVAGAVALGVLANAGLTSGTVYQVQKRTPTDQARTVYSNGSADRVVPEMVPELAEAVGRRAAADAPRDDQPDAEQDSSAQDLLAQVQQVRSRGAHRAGGAR